MKLGAFNDDLHTDIRHAAALAAERGLDGLAVRAVGGRNVADLDTAEVPAISRALAGQGLEVASIGSQFGRGLYVDDDTAQARATAHLQRAIRCAEICGTPLVRAFAGWLPGQEALTEWRRRPDGSGWVERVAAALYPGVRMAERAGVTLMFELEGASYAGTVDEARTIFDALGSASVALCWDVCNGWWSGEAPFDGLARLGDLPVVDVQTKDVPAEEGDPKVASLGRAVVGQGDIGYDRLLPELMRSGYDGWVTAERVHHPVKPEEDLEAQGATLADIAALQQILAPFGRRA